MNQIRRGKERVGGDSSQPGFGVRSQWLMLGLCVGVYVVHAVYSNKSSSGAYLSTTLPSSLGNFGGHDYCRSEVLLLDAQRGS
ncbi:hypothetical protein LZ31DRAFT_556055 [Colletotrichum somersetense]|nr:hypothetical protein LZ31DRAFT_556055 [Colletotrichum somersetense]